MKHFLFCLLVFLATASESKAISCADYNSVLDKISAEVDELEVKYRDVPNNLEARCTFFTTQFGPHLKLSIERVREYATCHRVIEKVKTYVAETELQFEQLKLACK